MNTMKRILLVIAVLGAAIGLAVPVAAQQEQPMTDAHIERIRANCTSALSIIQRLHTSDGPLYVNRVQQYEPMASKLMSQLNARLALNNLDASSMVKVTADYKQALSTFQGDYKKYDEHMKNLLTIDCRRQPVTFYDGVAKARQLRSTVHDDIVKMHQLITSYKTAFTTFYDQFKANPASGGNN